MNSLQSIKLPEVFGLVAKPRYVLGTTYTLSLAFFESAVYPEFDRSRLKSCLIICDSLGYQNALTESAALQGAAQDYMVVRAPISGSFHAKVWLIVGEGEFVLLTGSGNLTQAGFINNAEMFDALHFKTDSPPSATLLADIRSFLKGLGEMWSSEERQKMLCVETLQHIYQAVGEMPVAVAVAGAIDTTRFLHTFEGPLLEQLPRVAEAKEMYIAAPYFGDSLQGLDLLANRYPAARMNLFPAVHSGSTTNLPLDELRRARKAARISRLDVPSKSGGFAHLKLYAVSGADGSAWLYCTSANCTQAAWQGPNVEAGLLRRVAPALLKDYFVPGDEELPYGRLKLENNTEMVGVLHCWATDTGAGLDLHLSKDDRVRFPLHDVTLSVRAGSGLAICHRATLFQGSEFSNVPWTAFDGWQRRRKVSICLDLQGLDAGGKAVHAYCLIENRLLLSADPTHRSAWRGAQALLDAEGAPELGDIAAIFSMAGDVFDGNLIRVPDHNSAPENIPSKTETENIPVGIAVWPPQPDDHELARRIGSTALGQLQWFQHILRAFLHNPVGGDTAHEPNHGHRSHLVDEQDDYGEKPVADKDKKEDAAAKRAEKLWDYAYKDYQRLRDKLCEICPTAGNATNIWPAAIFAFLSTMAVFRSAKRIAPDLPTQTGITADMLCDGFFRTMFNYRQQHDDFCPPKSFRYRSEKFPPLAEDLYFVFKTSLHPDLACVVLGLAIDRKLRNPIFKTSAALTKEQKEMVCNQTFMTDVDTRLACRRIWRRYLCDELRKTTDAEFEQEFDAMFNFKAGTAS